MYVEKISSVPSLKIPEDKEVPIQHLDKPEHTLIERKHEEPPNYQRLQLKKRWKCFFLSCVKKDISPAVMHSVIRADCEFSWMHIYIDRQITQPIYTSLPLPSLPSLLMHTNESSCFFVLFFSCCFSLFYIADFATVYLLSFFVTSTCLMDSRWKLAPGLQSGTFTCTAVRVH